MRNFRHIRVQRYDDIPLNLISPRCIEKINDLLINHDTHDISDEYNDAQVRKKLIEYFGTKCVYCEGESIATNTYHIDHYRPKKGVKNLADHRGYYWLGYEWTNLLQSCQKCNEAKSNHFPLHNGSPRVSHLTVNVFEVESRIATSDPLNTENRLLLHPEIDEVEKHLIFHPDGTITSDTVFGKESISRYGLDRGDLESARKKVYDKYQKDLLELLEKYDEDIVNNPEMAREFLSRGVIKVWRDCIVAYLEREKFSLLQIQFYENFASIFISTLSQPQHRTILLDIYNEFYNL